MVCHGCKVCKIWFPSKRRFPGASQSFTVAPARDEELPTRLVYFLWSGAAFHLAGFAIFGEWRAKSIITLGSTKRPLPTGAIDLFVSPRGSTIQRQFVEPASLVPHTEIGANSAQAAALCLGEEATARGLERRHRRARKHTFDRRSHVSRGASSPSVSVRSSAFTQPSPARRPRRCAAAQQNLTRGDRRLWRNPV